MDIKISGKNIKIKKNENESEEKYNIRNIFISLLKPKTLKELDTCIMYSNIWINMIYLKCKYPKNIEKEIDNIIKNKEKILKMKKNLYNN